MRIFLLAIILLISTTVYSQNSRSDLGTWYMFNGKHKIANKWAVETMAHFRYYQLYSNYQQEIYRLAANYTVSNNFNITVGYAHATSDAEFGEQRTLNFDNRIYEDFNLYHSVNKFKFRHRFRFEHRFLRSNFMNETSNWIRYDVKINYPITSKLSVYAFNEIIANLDRNKLFAQYWAGFGVYQKISNTIKLTLGYLHIKLPEETLKRIQLGIVLNTNHIKK